MDSYILAFWLFTIIALVIGTILLLTVVTKQSDELTPEDQHNTVRSQLILLLGILVALIIIVFQMGAMVKGLSAMTSQ